MFLVDDAAGRRPVIRGRIDLGSARISGRLLIRNATVEARADVPAGGIYTGLDGSRHSDSSAPGCRSAPR